MARQEAAQKRREELRKQAARKRRRRTALRIIVPVVVIGGIVAGVLVASGGGSSNNKNEPLPGLQTSQLAPGQTWQPEYGHLQERLDALGLPAQSSMAANLHHHELLQIYIHGQQIEVPSQIGIDNQAGYLTSLHTHDNSGLIHIESPVERTFTLNEVFDVWGVRFTKSCLGGYCNNGQNQLKVFLDGKPYTDNPLTLVLQDRGVIVVTFGTNDELPKPIPSAFKT